jgi:hypothetical protein
LFDISLANCILHWDNEAVSVYTIIQDVALFDI